MSSNMPCSHGCTWRHLDLGMGQKIEGRNAGKSGPVWIPGCDQHPIKDW